MPVSEERENGNALALHFFDRAVARLEDVFPPERVRDLLINRAEQIEIAYALTLAGGQKG